MTVPTLLRSKEAATEQREYAEPLSASSDYLNSREAASYLHIKYRTLLEWARKALIPAIPLGAGSQRNTWLFSKSALDAHLRSKITINRPRSNQETTHVN
jgi:excisionase family DNA binding protein